MQAYDLPSYAEVCPSDVKPHLLLGNGFSISFSRSFSYSSLIDVFKEKNPEIIGFVEKFTTSNFEILLKELESAYRVNNYLELETQPIIEKGREIRAGLIHTIEQVHPRSSDINHERMNQVSAIIANSFEDVFL